MEKLIYSIYQDKNLIHLFEGKKNRRYSQVDGKSQFIKKDTTTVKNCNLGWELGPHYLVVDIDFKEDGTHERSFEKLVDLCPEFKDFKRNVSTPRKGHHYYFKFPDGFKACGKKQSPPEFPSIDFLTGPSNYVVIPPSVTPDGEYILNHDTIYDCPPFLLGFMKAQEPEPKPVSLAPQGNAADISKLSEALTYIDPNCTHKEWIDIGLAIKNSFPNDEGFTLWDNWSQGYTDYNESECFTQWHKYLKPNGQITIASVFHLAAKGGWSGVKLANFDWRNNYTYVNQLKSLINNATMMPVSKDSINNTHAKDVPKYDKEGNYLGFSINAYNDALRVGGFEMVDKLAYHPAKPYIFFDRDGAKCLNKFRPETVLAPWADDHTPQGLKFIEDVKAHILGLCNNDKRVFFFLWNWIKWQFQKPGQLVRWSPIVIGRPGIGKDFISTIFERIMGADNVGKITNETLNHQATGWANEKAVIIVEEMKIQGKERYTIMNKLKPFQTNDRITVRPLYANPTTVDNITHYFATSNYQDSLPILDESERRWFVIISDIKVTDEVKEKISKLYDQFKNEPGNAEQLHKFLLEEPIPAEFLAQKVAPSTKSKQFVIDNELEKIEGLIEIKDFIETTPANFANENIVITSLVFNEVFDEKADRIKPRQRTQILLALGYEKYKNTLRKGNAVYRAFVKGDYENALNVFKGKEAAPKLEAPPLILDEEDIPF